MPAEGGRRSSVLKATQFDECLTPMALRRAWRVGAPLVASLSLSLGCSFQASMRTSGESKTAANPPPAEPAPVRVVGG